MFLTGARVALGPLTAEPRDIEIHRGLVRAILEPGAGRRFGRVIDLSGHLILPGLINAHDHLEFNLYPRLGNGPYPNATAWARDIYRPRESPLREHLAVRKSTRLLWGGLKNLLNGVTTVCHHNPCELPVFSRNFPVRVLRRFGWAHSLEFSPDLQHRSQRTPPAWPFIVHLGEATDAGGRREIFCLDELGALHSRTVLVHAVALRGKGLDLARRKGASLVWCPSSNLFLLGRTLAPAVLRSGMPIALGTDSALTGEGGLLDELRVAHEVSGLPAAALYGMVTDQAGRVLRLSRGAGTVAEGAPADLMAVRDLRHSPSAALLCMPELQLVLVGGVVKLASPAAAHQLPPAVRRRLSTLHVEGREPVLVEADTGRLLHHAARSLGSDVRLAGRRILA